MTAGVLLGSLNHRNMPRRAARRCPVKARIVGYFDLPPERAEARSLVEGQRRWMIKGASVQPDARDRPRPHQFQRPIHQPAAGAAADQLRRHAEQAQFALTTLAKIELEHAFVPKRNRN